MKKYTVIVPKNKEADFLSTLEDLQILFSKVEAIDPEISNEERVALLSRIDKIDPSHIHSWEEIKKKFFVED